MTPIHLVLAVTAAAVVVAIALVCVGVAMIAGTGWALIAAGLLIGATGIAASVVLLRDTGDNG